MTIIQTRADLLPLTVLKKGSHRTPKQGACLLEAVAYVAGEPHTDRPVCACPILGAFGRSLNDVLPDDKRQRLVPLVPLIVGTAGDGRQQTRGLMAADWLLRTYTPTWLRLAGLDEAAVSLETMSGQATWDHVEAALPVVQAARKEAAAAGDAVWDAAWDAVGDAARTAAWDAARDAARTAAWAAVGDAAWAAAWDAARTAAWDAAGDAVGYDAWDAARAALQPTVDALQDSAIDLYRKMVEVSA